jgi:hypothetical protein
MSALTFAIACESAPALPAHTTSTSTQEPHKEGFYTLGTVDNTPFPNCEIKDATIPTLCHNQYDDRFKTRTSEQINMHSAPRSQRQDRINSTRQSQSYIEPVLDSEWNEMFNLVGVDKFTARAYSKN